MSIKWIPASAARNAGSLSSIITTKKHKVCKKRGKAVTEEMAFLQGVKDRQHNVSIQRAYKDPAIFKAWENGYYDIIENIENQ